MWKREASRAAHVAVFFLSEAFFEHPLCVGDRQALLAAVKDAGPAAERARQEVADGNAWYFHIHPPSAPAASEFPWLLRCQLLRLTCSGVWQAR